ncbi:hypothetical protein [Pseudomonas sp. L1(2025)]|uniref:hypothetical protein n=1 Tax=Pseudomonas sp. L1(2025) TaxID=3449429 RepID=UPI003F692965
MACAFKAAQKQLNKGCNKLAESQAKVDAKQRTQEAKMEKNDAVKALGGLFKSLETPGKKPRPAGAFLWPPGSLRLGVPSEQGCSSCIY